MFKAYLFGVVVIGFSMSAMAQHQTQTINCRIVGIADGDTVTCLSSHNHQLRIRLDQIDAPESNQDFGTRSKQHLSQLVFSQQVQAQITGQDQYGRLLGTIYHNNQNINKVMVRDGMAWAYKKYVNDQEYFRLEKQARDAKRGLWSHPNPIYPATFRYNQRQR
ncbi:hypothetical protein AAX09_10425 (plasmid) [Moraxella bovoculi]|uniref:thermonuclease family protein n=1 Tax=Moraxella bovoculi TaxID=386891 RepID=UPI0006246269|nr:thermonuclease family protein [Moraxella bovoculi]AKG19888.1 hypothetical protein AAX09_10425 [Moraxella bovoculi]